MQQFTHLQASQDIIDIAQIKRAVDKVEQHDDECQDHRNERQTP